MQQKIGIVGGGQLGKMLCMAAAPLSMHMITMDKDPEAVSKGYSHEHIKGNPLDYDDVMSLGQKVDIITIEMENVNADALKDLKKQGKHVHPDPDALLTIQDKGLQKQFFEKHNLPTSNFQVFETLDDLMKTVESGKWEYPFVVKACRGGYDGQGVFMIDSLDDIKVLKEGRYLIEEKVNLQLELSVIVGRNGLGECVSFPTCALHTHAEANLLSHMTAPAEISVELEGQAQNLAKQVMLAFNIQGVLAVELFLDQENTLWINEVSPRPHNTGHHTIEAAYTSQYQQHLRGIANLPLGNPEQLKPAALLNVLGPSGGEGEPIYDGLDKLLQMKGVYPHIYGKKKTKPHRKLGHITLLADSTSELDALVEKVQSTITIRV